MTISYQTIIYDENHPIRKLCLTPAATGALVLAQIVAKRCVISQLSGDTVTCLREGLSRVEKNRKWGFINKYGKISRSNF